MNVAVFGATGFVGSSLVPKLLRRGHHVRMISRTSPIGGVPEGATHRTADIGSFRSVENAVQAADVVVNLVAASPLLPAGNRAVYLRRHLRGVNNLLAALRGRSASLVHVGAMGVTEQSPAYYAWTKARAERLVRTSKIDAIVVSPSIVFGERSELIAALSLMSRLPLVPVPRIPTLFQPVWIEDLTDLLAQLVDDRQAYCTQTPCRQIEVGGPDVMSGTQFARAFFLSKQKPCVEVPSAAIATAIAIGRALHLPGFPIDLPMMLEMENRATGRFPLAQTTHSYRAWLETDDPG